MDEQPRSVTVTRTREDYFPFCREVTKGFKNMRIYYVVALMVLLIIYINGAEMVFRNHLLPAWIMNSKYLLFCLAMTAMIALMCLLRKCFMPTLKREYLNDNQAFLRKREVAFDKRGYRETSDVSDAFVAWQGVDRIEKTKLFLLVYVDKTSAFCIPIRNFESPAAAEAFYQDMLACWKAATALKPAPSPA